MSTEGSVLILVQSFGQPCFCLHEKSAWRVYFSMQRERAMKKKKVLLNKLPGKPPKQWVGKFPPSQVRQAQCHALTWSLYHLLSWEVEVGQTQSWDTNKCLTVAAKLKDHFQAPCRQKWPPFLSQQGRQGWENHTENPKKWVLFIKLFRCFQQLARAVGTNYSFFLLSTTTTSHFLWEENLTSPQELHVLSPKASVIFQSRKCTAIKSLTNLT